MFKLFMWYSRSTNILAQMIYACIRLSSHCNFFRLKVTLRHKSMHAVFMQVFKLVKLKWKIDTLNPKNQQKCIGSGRSHFGVECEESCSNLGFGKS